MHVVKDQEGRAADLLEKLGVGHDGVSLIGGAQTIEQIRHDHVEGRCAPLDAVVGHGRAERRLAAAALAPEQEPARPWLLAAREAHGGGEGAAKRRRVFPLQGLEADPGQRPQIAVTLQPLLAFLLRLPRGTVAGNRPTEFGMAGIPPQPDEARVVAESTSGRSRRKRRRFSGG